MRSVLQSRILLTPWVAASIQPFRSYSPASRSVQQSSRTRQTLPSRSFSALLQASHPPSPRKSKHPLVLKILHLTIPAQGAGILPSNYKTVPNSLPTPAVRPMASAPQKATRIAPCTRDAPPAYAAVPPKTSNTASAVAEVTSAT